ncbi:MAG: adenylate/guanylate cyclase domain-containing protein [Candidatus Schekmanbacteria bacterium]|nr:adenylate/guanylate cyclase domain-containing protein [Candidatus Schekmanbacteria bacterium]
MQRHALARKYIAALALVWSETLTFTFGGQIPIYLWFMVVAFACALLFPNEEQTAAVLTIALCAIGIGVWLWVRSTGFRIVEFSSTVRVIIEYASIAGVFSLAVTCATGMRRLVSTAEAEMLRERDRSERLLLNILPASIAHRLKQDHSAIADGIAEVTVLFADIAGFTPMSARLSAAEVVELLNRVFTEFDALAEKHGLEKIKTIGDAYMAAAGLPEARDDHAFCVANMALDMMAIAPMLASAGERPLELRIGISTGPVVAGVIGRKRFIYDLWGDTVNMASRMESHGKPGTIQVTEATYDRLVGKFQLEERGEIDVKGVGPRRTWYLVSRTGDDTKGDPDGSERGSPLRIPDSR